MCTSCWNSVVKGIYIQVYKIRFTRKFQQELLVAYFQWKLFIVSSRQLTSLNNFFKTYTYISKIFFLRQICCSLTNVYLSFLNPITKTKSTDGNKTQKLELLSMYLADQVIAHNEEKTLHNTPHCTNVDIFFIAFWIIMTVIQ